MEENNETIAGFEVFSSAEDLAASAENTVEQPVDQGATENQAEPQAEPQVQQDYFNEPQQQVQNEQPHQPEYTDSEIEDAVLEFMSDRLGREITSLDELNSQENKAIDSRVEAIARFVEETGRAPEDWFRYQSLNPEGMDDMTAIRIQMSNQYPNLSYDELNLLASSKYKLDEDMYSDEEIKLAKLQLKIDGDNARKSIEEIRSGYSAPQSQEGDAGSVIDQEWIANMNQEVDTLEGLEFDLGGDNILEFGLDDDYRSQLKDKQSRLDEFFYSYVREDGSWDYDTLSSHLAVIDNIDRIVRSAYTKGLGDGQRTLVNTASNVSTQAPQTGNQNQQTNPLADQVRQLIRSGNGGVTFNI